MSERKDGEGCKGCIYRSKDSCDYCYKTGYSRGCPPGKGCIRFEKATKSKRLKKYLAEF